MVRELGIHEFDTSLTLTDHFSDTLLERMDVCFSLLLCFFEFEFVNNDAYFT